MVDRPPRRTVATVPIGRSGRESLVALALLAAIVFLLTDSVLIGVALLGLGVLVLGWVLSLAGRRQPGR
ncbi:MAG TPA: hypothetical protein VGI17_14880 [Solirubrobacterales bacterium]|jgi:hypothetical protein